MFFSFPHKAQKADMPSGGAGKVMLGLDSTVVTGWAMLLRSMGSVGNYPDHSCSLLALIQTEWFFGLSI